MALGDTKTFEFVDESTGFLTTLTVTELEGGVLSVVLDVDESAGTTGDARAIYFNLTDNTEITGLTINVDDANSDVGDVDTDMVQDIDSVRYVEERDTSINGEVLKENDGKFDVGIEFGSSGIGKDDVQHMEFTLSADTALSIDTFDFTTIGFRATSVGDVDGSRNDSLKLTGDETDDNSGPGTVVAEDDFFSVDGDLLGGASVVNTGNAYADNGSGEDFDPEGDSFQIISVLNSTTTDDTADANGWFDWLAGGRVPCECERRC